MGLFIQPFIHSFNGKSSWIFTQKAQCTHLLRPAQITALPSDFSSCHWLVLLPSAPPADPPVPTAESSVSQGLESNQIKTESTVKVWLHASMVEYNFRSYFEILCFILWRFQKFFEQSDFFICYIGTVRLHRCPESEIKRSHSNKINSHVSSRSKDERLLSLYLLGASFLGTLGMSCGSSVNSYSWTLDCKFLDLGRPGPGPGWWLPLPSNFCFFGLWRDVAAGSGSFPIFRKRLSPFLSCQSVRICIGISTMVVSHDHEATFVHQLRHLIYNFMA